MLYIPDSVEEVPEEVIVSWRIYEATFQDNTTSRHVVGNLDRTGMGRVSSAIQQFNKEVRTVLTKSGRVYQLAGEPCLHLAADNGDYVWAQWAFKNKVGSIKDVTEEYAQPLSN